MFFSKKYIIFIIIFWFLSVNRSKKFEGIKMIDDQACRGGFFMLLEALIKRTKESNRNMTQSITIARWRTAV
jgi:hypothetical protein